MLARDLTMLNGVQPPPVRLSSDRSLAHACSPMTDSNRVEVVVDHEDCPRQVLPLNLLHRERGYDAIVEVDEVHRLDDVIESP